jgi:hypothetical protein
MSHAPRWVIGEVEGVYRTEPRHADEGVRPRRDGFRLQAVQGTVTAVRDVRTPPDGWDDARRTVILGDVVRAAREASRTGIFRRRTVSREAVHGVHLVFPMAAADLDPLALDRSIDGARLLDMRSFDQRPHPEGGYVARFTARYAAPLPQPPVPPAPPVPVRAPEPRIVAPSPAPDAKPRPPVAAPDADDPLVVTAPRPAPPSVPPAPRLPTGLDGDALLRTRPGCLPSFRSLFDGWTFGLGGLGGCLMRMLGALITAALMLAAIFIGTFLLAGALWGGLGRLLPPGWLDRLEPIRTAVPPPVAALIGVGAALLIRALRRR